MFSARRKPVLLPFEGHVGHADPLVVEGGHHALGLVGRNHAVLEALNEDHGAVEPIGGMDGGALAHDGHVGALTALVGADQVHVVA